MFYLIQSILILVLLLSITLIFARIFYLTVRPLYNNENVPPKADIVIIGGGTSGCVLARRLADKYPDKYIVMLEQGLDQRRNRDVYRSENALNIAYTQPYSLVMNSEYPGIFCTMGTMVGGSSSHNFGLVVSGTNKMYTDTWLDKLKLSFADLSKCIEQVYSQIDVTPITTSISIFPKIMPLINLGMNEGPIPIYQAADVYFNLGPLRANDKLSKNMTRAMEISSLSILETKVPLVEDYNSHGCCISESQQLYINTVTGTRASANTQYLPESYRPKNLTIVTSAKVDVISGNNIKLNTNFSKNKEIFANKIIVSCGGLMSPYLLVKSGIISNEFLKNTLVNHYGTQYIFAIKNISDFASGPIAYLPNLDNPEKRELQIITSGSILTNTQLLKDNGINLDDYSGYNLVSYLVFLLDPQARGTLTYIPGKDVPKIELNLYHPVDMDNLILGHKWINSNYINLKEKYDIQAVLPNEKILQSTDRKVVENSIKRGVIIADHYSCTLSNLVDENFELSDNIYVVDNSVLPHITDGNTQFPAMLIGEIAAIRI